MPNPIGRPRGATYTRDTPCRRGHFLFYISGNRCVECQTIRSYEYHKNNAVKIRARSAKWKLDNPERVKSNRRNTQKASTERARLWRENNRDLILIKSRKKRGLPDPLYSAPALCECCGKSSRKNVALCLDHDHETGKFRGWLCYSCNVGIGYLGDTLKGVQSAINYLKSKK